MNSYVYSDVNVLHFYYTILFAISAMRTLDFFCPLAVFAIDDLTYSYRQSNSHIQLLGRCGAAARRAREMKSMFVRDL
jgi:hypothetical protein